MENETNKLLADIHKQLLKLNTRVRVIAFLCVAAAAVAAIYFGIFH